MVMPNDMSIEVVGANGLVRVTSTGALERKYEWSDCSLSTTMITRASRWYGSKGAYDPAASLGIFSWGCEGISRAVVQEGQIHFDDEEFAREWVRRKSGIFETTWSTDGLLISWGFSPERSQLNFDVWLMCLDGEPFDPGSTYGLHEPVVISGPSGSTIHDCVHVEQSEIDQTRKQIEKSWAEADAWRQRRHAN